MSELQRIVPSLLVRDMAETLSFYRKLGFVVSGHDGNEAAAGWAEVHRGNVVIQFYTDPPHGTPTEPICSGTFYVFGDVDALVEELRGIVEFAWGPETMDYGMKEFGVQDPNGYFIAFTQPA